MMTSGARLWRLFASLIGTLIFGLGTSLMTLTLTVGLCPLPLPIHRKRTLTRHVISHAARLYLRTLRRLGILTYEFRRADRLNQQGLLVVANHPTLLDAILLMSVMPDATFIMKAAVARNPFILGLAWLAGYLPNSIHGQHFIDRTAEILRHGQTLVIFPEGTRTVGNAPGVFQRGAAHIALGVGCRILPVVIECQPVFMRKHESWFRALDRTPHYRIVVLDAVDIDAIAADEPDSLRARKITRLLYNSITDQLQALQTGQSV